MSDWDEIGALHGKVAPGFLIVQDLFVVLCMVILPAIGPAIVRAIMGDLGHRRRTGVPGRTDGRADP
ncbi:MAG: hypothetical protein MUF73_04430 [Rhodobacteraceae bacterium]|nr:hypothetical protein [Paracoccaceae bacterium]